MKVIRNVPGIHRPSMAVRDLGSNHDARGGYEQERRLSRTSSWTQSLTGNNNGNSMISNGRSSGRNSNRSSNRSSTSMRISQAMPSW